MSKQLINRLQVKEEKHISKNKTFKVPEGYFESLPDKLIDRLHNEHPETSYKRTFNIFKPYIYLAAGLLTLTVLMKAGLHLLVDPIAPTEATAENETIILDETIYDILIADDYSLFDYIASAESDAEAATFYNDEYEQYLIYNENIELDLYLELENL